MRADLARHGVEEAHTPADVDRILAENETVLMVVNSMCGCAAGRARPAVGLALRHAPRAPKAATVFAGGDVEATAHVRSLLAGYPPSSPSMAIFRQGKPVYMMHRSEIESRDPVTIAQSLLAAFESHCG